MLLSCRARRLSGPMHQRAKLDGAQACTSCAKEQHLTRQTDHCAHGSPLVWGEHAQTRASVFCERAIDCDFRQEALGVIMPRLGRWTQGGQDRTAMPIRAQGLQAEI